MPVRTLWPLAKNAVKYGAIMAGGKLLYDHSLSLAKPWQDLCAKAPEQLQSDWAKFLIGVAALGVAHFVLSKSVQRKESKKHFLAEANEKKPPAEQEAPPPEPAPQEGAEAKPAKSGNIVLSLVGFVISILPKAAVAMAGGYLVITTAPILPGIYTGVRNKLVAVQGIQVFSVTGGNDVVAHVLSSVLGLVLILLGYAIVRRGIARRHGPLHRLIFVNDRRVESLHWDTAKIRGFGMQLQTSDTEGLIGDLTPTADAYVTHYDHQGKHKGHTSTVMYLRNLEPEKKPLDKLDGSHVKAVREAIAEMNPDKTVTATELEKIDIERLKRIVTEKNGNEMSDTNLGRVLLALMTLGGENVGQADEGKLLEHVNDVETGYEGGLFHRVLYRKDSGGHYVPIATIAEDLTLTDRITSSPRNGYGPNYWRRGKALMAFWISRGAADDSAMIRMQLHQIRKSLFRRWWDWGASYRWTLRQHNLRIDEDWCASYRWLSFVPGIVPRRFFTVRDSRGEIVATMREIFWSKCTLDMNWRVEIYCDRLNNEDAGNTLALLTEFLHNRQKYLKSRTAPGNTAHERLLVGGGKKRGDATESIGGGL